MKTPREARNVGLAKTDVLAFTPVGQMKKWCPGLGISILIVSITIRMNIEFVYILIVSQHLYRPWPGSFQVYLLSSLPWCHHGRSYLISHSSLQGPHSLWELAC